MFVHLQLCYQFCVYGINIRPLSSGQGTVLCPVRAIWEPPKNGFTVKVRYGSNTISVDIVKSKVVKKYVNPDNTPFVTYEYDNSLLIEWSSSAYSKALVTEGQKTLDFESSDGKVIFSETRDFSIGDKASLIYNQRVSYSMLSAYLTEDNAKKIASTIVVK